jgi:hypothetical protein
VRDINARAASSLSSASPIFKRVESVRDNRFAASFDSPASAGALQNRVSSNRRFPPRFSRGFASMAATFEHGQVLERPDIVCSL